MPLLDLHSVLGYSEDLIYLHAILALPCFRNGAHLISSKMLHVIQLDRAAYTRCMSYNTTTYAKHMFDLCFVTTV